MQDMQEKTPGSFKVFLQIKVPSYEAVLKVAVDMQQNSGQLGIVLFVCHSHIIHVKNAFYRI